MSVCLYLLVASVFAAICVTMAADRNRSVAGWFTCGALFGLVAVFVLWSLDPLPKQERRP